MKKTILVLLVMIGLFSCSPELVEVENPERSTSIEALNNVSDTLAVCDIDGTIYLIDLETSLVKYNFQQSSGDYIVVGIWTVMLLMTSIFLNIFTITALAQ